MTVKENATDAAATVADRTRTAATDAADAAQAEVHARADSARKGVADEVHSVSSALRTAAEEMRDGSAQERMIGQVAGTLADVSDSIRDKDMGEMVRTTRDFARRNPTVFLGSAAFLGFAAARLAKSSGQSAGQSEGQPSPSRAEVNASRKDWPQTNRHGFPGIPS